MVDPVDDQQGLTGRSLGEPIVQLLLFLGHLLQDPRPTAGLLGLVGQIATGDELDHHVFAFAVLADLDR